MGKCQARDGYVDITLNGDKIATYDRQVGFNKVWSLMDNDKYQIILQPNFKVLYKIGCITNTDLARRFGSAKEDLVTLTQISEYPFAVGAAAEIFEDIMLAHYAEFAYTEP